MGRLFSYDEIKTGRIPTPETFNHVKCVFQESIQEGIINGTIDGGLIYGSVAVDKQSCRSDFDSIIILRNNDLEARMAGMAVSQIIRQETDNLIPIDIATRTKKALAEGWHDIDRFFGQHLASEDRIVYGNDIATYIKHHHNNISAKDILSDYLIHKSRRFDTAYRISNPLDISEGGLQRMLELPRAIGQRVLQTIIEIEHSNQQVRTVDQRLVLKKSQEIFTEYDLDEGFNTLAEKNKEYNELLSKTIQGKIGQKAYENFILELHATLPCALNWIDQIQEKLMPDLD